MQIAKADVYFIVWKHQFIITLVKKTLSIESWIVGIIVEKCGECAMILKMNIKYRALDKGMIVDCSEMWRMSERKGQDR